jgi:hypothetical protein
LGVEQYDRRRTRIRRRVDEEEGDEDNINPSRSRAMVIGDIGPQQVVEDQTSC